jgi:hypothetical protein
MTGRFFRYMYIEDFKELDDKPQSSSVKRDSFDTFTLKTSRN